MVFLFWVLFVPGTDNPVVVTAAEPARRAATHSDQTATTPSPLKTLTSTVALPYSPTNAAATFSPAAAVQTADAARLDAEITGKMRRLVLLPLHEAVLSAETSGKVARVHFQLGGAFKSGEELVTMDDVFFLAAREKARSALNAAQVTLDALSDLRKRNDASVMEIENAKRDHSAAKAELALAERNYAACHVRAPYAGRVAEVFINEHELVEAGRPLVKIIEDSTLLGHIFLPGRFYTRIKLGQPVPLEFPEAGLTTTGEIARIAPAIDPASGMFEAYLKIDNRAGRLRSGLTGWVAAEKIDVQ